MAELQLRSEVMLIAIDGKAERERAGEQRPVFTLIAHPDVVAHGPFSVSRPEVLEPRGLGRIAQQRGQRAAAPVVILPREVGDALAFHVRLAGEDEYFDPLR